ncbi:MAG: anthranilate synthase component I [Deltaproteobacteria bacterium CG_4_8_14_3_um_filter_51_11]|nr:anthranilate synthase component I [bacterium]OIP43702.1 MAG: anthranilate synthase component I [Desulfobacteraceae bacterium CG2_30_51_40]PIP48140.1 MAG: anthranilate synthase component I [Deltaproteobacteria bacterium CG23_combo_of_CG06-09_8_20_14_all_51_20]PIV99334.1 MAG: anthranilate synthase component I [Deltaproteobacteria bacterium CG17_big_fil_post_rev_8_21_14_2_50_51_6]PIX19446.1 MAG: anthranilate synthase component I [Deltaproteobacteria bacterium CG_4_8_14_3_um_filter_51_11]PIY233
MILSRFPEKEAFRRMAHTANIIPVCIEILADTETPVSILQKLYTVHGPIFLFESAEGGERWGRYSFLGASAKARVRLFRTHVEIEEAGSLKRICHNGRPLPILRAIMAGFRPADIPGLPRFWGGLVGYFTYEMVSFFEKIPNRLADERPIADFIIPDELIIFDNIRHTLVALAIAFTHSVESVDAAYEEAAERVAKLIAAVQGPMPAEPPVRPQVPCILLPQKADADYRKMVDKAKTYIRQGEIIQAVVSQPFSCAPAPDLRTLYRAQRYINPSPYLYLLRMGETALVGSSPETMVRLENRIATLRPIAGTRPRGKTEQEDRALADEMLKDEKERAEHLMLVDLGRNDLGRVAVTGTVQVTELMMVERYSHVMHLVSNVRCDLRRELDAWDLLAATFPAGTLSGAPKIRAMQIIDKLENEPRGPYGGAVGYISFSGNMDMAITIRTACIEAERLTVRAGAGIVADSDPEKERVETVHKAMSIQKALELAGRQYNS